MESIAVFLHSLTAGLPQPATGEEKETQAKDKDKVIRTKVSMVVGEFESEAGKNTSDCSCVLSYQDGPSGVAIREAAKIKENTVTLAISFGVSETIDPAHLKVLYDGVENLLCLLFADSNYNLEERLDKVEGRTIYSLHLELGDKSIFENSQKLVEYYKIESLQAKLQLSHSPKAEDKQFRENKFTDLKFLLECDVHHGIAGLIEGIFFSARQQAQLMQQQQLQQPPQQPTPTADNNNNNTHNMLAAKLVGFSGLLKRVALNLDFDSLQELFENAFARQLPEQYRIINWDTITAALYEPVLHLICSKDENNQRMAHAYSKLEFLEQLESIKLVIGDHVFIFQFHEFTIFQLLPDKQALNVAKKEREEKEKEIEAQREKEKEKLRKSQPVIVKSEEELRQEALEKLKIAAGKKAKQDGKVMLKVLLLGDEGVGKTSLLSRIAYDRLPARSRPTSAADVTTTQMVVEDMTFTLKLWDSAGQAGFASPDVAFYKGVDVLVLVFDVTERQSFENIEGWYQQFLKHATPKNVATFPVVVVGNKVEELEEEGGNEGTGKEKGENEKEREKEKEGKRKVAKEEAQRWCEAKGENFVYIETSAKAGIRVKEAFEFAALKGASYS